MTDFAADYSGLIGCLIRIADEEYYREKFPERYKSVVLFQKWYRIRAVEGDPKSTVAIVIGDCGQPAQIRIGLHTQISTEGSA